MANLEIGDPGEKEGSGMLPTLPFKRSDTSTYFMLGVSLFSSCISEQECFDQCLEHSDLWS
jgi:hypothetical protein